MGIEVPLVDIEEVKNSRGGGGRGKGEKYSRYTKALESHVEWLKDQIANSKDGHIRVKSTELAKGMGIDLKKNEKGPGLHPTSFYWGTRYAAFHNGMVVTSGQTKAGEPLLVLRLRTEKDELPPSLAKGEEGDEGEEDIGITE